MDEKPITYRFRSYCIGHEKDRTASIDYTISVGSFYLFGVCYDNMLSSSWLQTDETYDNIKLLLL